MKKYILELFRYNQWANQRISEWILNAGEKTADTSLSSSFPTIRKTIYHVWDAQVIWLARLKGTSLNAWPSQNFTGTLEEALQELNAQSGEFVRFLEETEENSLEKEVVFHALDGTRYSQKAIEIIQHVVNHGTYHRGQIITMLRTAGFEAVGSTDLIRYYRSR